MKSLLKVGAVQPRQVLEPGKKDPLKYAEDIALVTYPDKDGKVVGDFDSLHISGRIANKDLFGKLTPGKRYELTLTELPPEEVGSNVTLAPSEQAAPAASEENTGSSVTLAPAAQAPAEQPA